MKKQETPPHKRVSKISTTDLLEKMEANHKLFQERQKKLQTHQFGVALSNFIKKKYFSK